MGGRVVEVVGVVLAAGASIRMGRSKAELTWRGIRFVEHCVRALSDCSHVLVVTGAHPLTAVPGATLVENPGWEGGQFHSLRVGLNAASKLADGAPVIVHTVDRPHVSSSTIDALLDAAAQRPQMIWQPRHDGAAGHPIVLPADIVPQVCAAPLSATMRTIVRAHPERRARLDVADPGVLDNLDRPEDLDRLPT